MVRRWPARSRFRAMERPIIPRPMTPRSIFRFSRLIPYSFADHRDGLDFDQVLFADELFHYDQRAGGRVFRVDVTVPRITQRLQIRRVGQVVVELDHVFERGSAFFKPRLEILKDLFDLGAEIATANQVSVFVERNLPGDVKRAPAFYLDDMRIARRRAIDEPDVSLLFFHGLLLLCSFLLIHGLMLRPPGSKAEQTK